MRFPHKIPLEKDSIILLIERMVILEAVVRWAHQFKSSALKQPMRKWQQPWGNGGCRNVGQNGPAMVTGTIPIDLVVDMMFIMESQAGLMVALQMIPMEVVQRAPHPPSLEEGLNMTVWTENDSYKWLANRFAAQQEIQNNMTSTLRVIHQFQRDHVNDSLIHDILMFDG